MATDVGGQYRVGRPGQQRQRGSEQQEPGGLARGRGARQLGSVVGDPLLELLLGARWVERRRVRWRRGRCRRRSRHGPADPAASRRNAGVREGNCRPRRCAPTPADAGRRPQYGPTVGGDAAHPAMDAADLVDRALRVGRRGRTSSRRGRCWCAAADPTGRRGSRSARRRPPSPAGAAIAAAGRAVRRRTSTRRRARAGSGGPRRTSAGRGCRGCAARLAGPSGPATMPNRRSPMPSRTVVNPGSATFSTLRWPRATPRLRVLLTRLGRNPSAERSFRRGATDTARPRPCGAARASRTARGSAWRA